MILPESISRVIGKDVYDASGHKLAVGAWVRWPDGQWRASLAYEDGERRGHRRRRHCP